MSHIAGRFIQMIAESYQIPVEKITPETSFESMGIDSLGAMSMIGEIEEEFNISVPNEDVLTMSTVGQALACLQRLVPEEGDTPAERVH
ncbi:MAG: acyl carrier protein [Gemmatimonadota bacterium]|nr:acyl carrier protein [Gemmatimonadota bacterium]